MNLKDIRIFGKPESCKKCGHKFGTNENIVNHLTKYHLEIFIKHLYYYIVTEQTQDRILHDLCWFIPEEEEEQRDE